MSVFLQRIAIGAGALVVVVLTVMVAVFLAMQDLPQDDEPTSAAQVSPTPVIADTSALSPTPSPTLPLPALTDTPTATPTPVPPVEPTPTPTPAPATATDTPEPLLPTPTPLPALPTATPTPAALTNCGAPPPPGWVAYIVQAGDTFNSLARRTDISVFDLQEANCLRTLRNGDRLYLPYYPPPPTPTGTRNPTRRPGPTPTRTPTPINPFIISVSPDVVDEQTSSQEIIISVFGGNFRSREVGFRAELRGPQSPVLQLQGDGTDTNFTAIVPANLPVGSYDLVVTNPNNRAGVKPSAFIIGQAPPGPPPVPKPNIIAVEPESGFNNQERTIEIRGFNFRPNLPGFLVELRIGLTFVAELERVGQATRTSVTVIVPAGLAAEVYDVWVINPGGQEDVAPGAYESLQF